MKQSKLKWLLKILFAMTEFWFFGIPIAGGFAALVYISTSDQTSALFTFCWAAFIYFLLDFSDTKEKVNVAS